jgi:copper ion binding protein
MYGIPPGGDLGAERGAPVSSTDYTVRGMTCDHCVGAVTAEVTRIPGVTGVQVDVAAGRLTVEADRPVSTEAVTEAVEEAGYEVVPA